MKTLRLFLFAITIPIFAAANLMPIDFSNVELIMDQYQEDWKLFEIDNRIYVKEETVLFLDDTFFIFIDPYLIPANIQYDLNGYYFCHEGFYNWECCKCHHWNSKHLNTCQKCYGNRC